MSHNITKVAVLNRDHQLTIKQLPLPPLGDYDVLLDQKTCNICTTDYTQFQGLREHQGFPMAGGHEGAGVIRQVGSKVTNFKVGDHVGVMCRSCGRCDNCKNGHEGLCYQNDLTTYHDEHGIYGSFGFADQIVISSQRLVKIDPEIEFAKAGFLEPLATVVKSYKLLDVKPGETIVIIGAGTMGLLNALFYKSISCRVILSEIDKDKIAHAKAIGFTVIDAKNEDLVKAISNLTDGHGADTVLLAVGSSTANEQAFDLVKANYGKICFFAAVYPEPQNTLSSNLIHYRRLKLVGTTGADYADFIDAARLLNTKQFDFSVLLETAYFDLNTINQAFEYASLAGKYRVTVHL